MKELKAKLISVGWGSSGYYSARTLRLAEREQAFTAGTQMFINHPTRAEMAERPEGDLTKLAGELLETAYYDEHPTHGKGLYAKIKVFTDYETFVTEKGTNLSIMANGIKKAGEAPESDGSLRKGFIVERIIPNTFNHVDFVTKAGAGGKLIFESAKPLPDNNYLLYESTQLFINKDNLTMSLEEKVVKLTQQLTEARTALETALNEVNTLKDAKGAVEAQKEALQGKLNRYEEATALTEALADEKYTGLKAHERKAIKALVTVTRSESGDVDTTALAESVAREAEPFLTTTKQNPTHKLSMGTGSLVTITDSERSEWDSLAESAKTNLYGNNGG